MEMNQVLIEQSNLFFKWLEQYFKAWFSWIHLLSYSWIVYSWQRSTVTDGECKLHASNAAGIRCKTCEKMATSISGKNYYSMTTMRIGYEKTDRKVELCTSGEHSTIRTSMTTCTLAWHCTTQTSMTTCMLAWLRTMHTPLNTSTERHAQFSDSHLDLIHTIGSRFQSRLSYHPHGHPRACGLLASTFSFYLPFFLPSLFFFLFLFLTNKKFMANLYNSAKESVDTNDVLSFSTGYEPKANDIQDSLSSNPTQPRLRTLTTMTLHSKTCTYQARRAQASHSLREDLSVNLSSSSMSDGTGQPVGDRPGQPGEYESSEAQIGTLLGEQKTEISCGITLLKGCSGLHSYRRDALMGRQIFGIHLVYQETFLHIHRLLHQLRILKNWTLLGRKLLRNRFTCLQRRKVEDQNEIKIWDASPDREPKIQSSSVEETLSRIMGQTNNDCRFRISILTSSLHQQPLLAGRKFKTEVCICSQFLTEALHWIKEVKMVDSVDDLRSSSSTRGISMPNFEVLDARDCFSPEQDHP